MPFYCYLLSCRDGSLYCGWTTDLDRRIATHQNGKGARYTRTRLPVALVYSETLPDRPKAMQREWEIKQMERAEKLDLIKGYEKEIN